jgi:tellurite resistance protein TehA-like permease
MHIIFIIFLSIWSCQFIYLVKTFLHRERETVQCIYSSTFCFSRLVLFAIIYKLVGKAIDINAHERQSNIMLGHKSK